MPFSQHRKPSETELHFEKNRQCCVRTAGVAPELKFINSGASIMCGPYLKLIDIRVTLVNVVISRNKVPSLTISNVD